MTTEATPAGLMEWMLSGKTGLSSLCIVQVLTHTPAPTEWYMRGRYPLDPSDFGRCLGLLAAVPEFEGRLDAVARVYPMWAPLVREWDALKALYIEEVAEGTGLAPRLYSRMKELENEARATVEATT